MSVYLAGYGSNCTVTVFAQSPKRSKSQGCLYLPYDCDNDPFAGRIPPLT
jgi:hypothetical protein